MASQHVVSTTTALSSSIQNRAYSYIIQATDLLLQRNLITHFITWIQYLTHGIEEIMIQQGRIVSTPTTTSLLIFYIQQRHVATQALFYISYHTQLHVPEIIELMDLVCHLTNGNSSSSSSTTMKWNFCSGLPILDPFKDVPDPFVLIPSSSLMTMQDSQ